MSLATSDPVAARAWRATIAMFVAALGVGGLVYQGFGIYLNALVQQRDMQSGLVAVCGSAMLATIAFGTVFLAPLFGRISVTALMATGAVVAGAALVVLGRVTTEPMALVAAVVLGMGVTVGAFAPLVAFIGRAFGASRPSSIVPIMTVLAGWSLGGIIVAAVVPDRLEVDGLDATLLVAGLVLAAALVLAAVGIAGRADPFGRAPRFAHRRDELDDVDDVEGVGDVAELHGRFYGTTTAAFTVLWGVQTGATLSLYGVVTERAGTDDAAIAVATAASAALLYRFVGAAFVARFAKLRFALMMTVVLAGSCLLLSFAQSPWLLFVAAGALGGVDGTLLLVHPLLVFDRVGARAFPATYGRAVYVMVAGLAAGPSMFGIVHDVQGYTGAFLLAAALTMLAFIVLGAAGSRRASPSSGT